MRKIHKTDVDEILRSVNEIIPQESKTIKREIQADYIPQYGGWKLCYFDEKGKGHAINQLRMTSAEVYRFLEGMLYSINAF